MIEENFYKTDKLIRVCVVPAELNYWYEFRKQIKILGVTFQKKGYYSGVFSKKFVCESPPKGKIIVNGMLCNYPCVVLYYQNNHRKKYNFETVEKAKAFSERVMNGTREWRT